MGLLARYFLLLATPLMMTVSLKAQNHQEVDLALTYATQNSNLVSTPTFWQQGGSVELSTQSCRGLGIEANVTGTIIDNAADSGVGLNIVTTTFGPRYTWYRPTGAARRRGIAIFGQGLIGESHGFNSYFPSKMGVQTDYNSFALRVGGGIDFGRRSTSPSELFRRTGCEPSSPTALLTYKITYISEPESSSASSSTD